MAVAKPRDMRERCALNEPVARQRETRGPSADVHAMAGETPPTERHPDVADVLKSVVKRRRSNLIDVASFSEHG